MGEVWRALDHERGEVVALKRILDAGGDDLRFVREARLLERVSHDALVAHVAHGVDEGRPFLAMAWVEGETLEARLARAPLTLAETLTLGRRVASALGALHGAGVVHRDVKPANVILRGGRPEDAVLLDLGIASVGSATQVLTGTNLVIGTVGYMAPEQARSGRDVNARADVFSLGCVLFECASGEPVFGGDNAIAILARVLVEQARPLRSVRPDVPEALDRLVASMLAHHPSERPADAAAIERALAEIEARGLGASLPAPQPAPRLSTYEQSFALAAVVSVAADASPLGPTLGSSDAERELARIGEVIGAANGELAPLGPSTALVVAKGRGTAADRARATAQLLEAALAAQPAARAGMTAGLSLTRAGQPAGELLGAAAALAARAPSGRIAVDEAVAELLADRYRVEDGALARREGARRGAAFVGREKEMALLEATLAEVRDESSPRVVIVTASPGTGKSRLGRELAARLRGDELRVVEARGELATAGAAGAALRSVLRALVGLPASADPLDETTFRVFVGEQRALAAPARVADFLLDAAGAAIASPGTELTAARRNPELMRTWQLRSLRELLHALTTELPVALLIDDAQWADELTLRLFGEAVRELDESPIFLVCLARPEGLEKARGAWPRASHWALGELGARASARLVREVLGDGDDAAVQRILERGAGNPLFLEELARFANARAGDALPANVAAVLHARLEHLSARARLVLRAASVLGERFSAEGAAEIASLDRADVERMLESLDGLGLIEPHEARWAFHHALVRDAAYATLSPADAKVAHARAAAYLAAQPRADVLALADHFELAGEPARALEALRSRARDASALAQLSNSAAMLERGRRLGGSREALADLHAYHSLWAATESDWVTALTHAEEALPVIAPGTDLWFLVASVCIFAGGRAGRTDLVGAVLPGFLSGSFPANGYTGASINVATMGLLGAKQRDLAYHLLDRARARSADDLSWRVWVGMAGVWPAMFARGDVAEVLRSMPEIEALADEVGDVRGAINARYLLAWANLEAGDLRGALAHVDATAERARDAPKDARMWCDHSAIVAARAHLELGELDAAGAHLAALVSSEDTTVSQRAAHLDAEVALARGDLERAAAIAATVRSAQYAYAHIGALASRVALRSGDAPRALELARKAHESAVRGATAPSLLVDAGAALVEALRANGSDAEASMVLTEVVARASITADGLDPTRRRSFWTALAPQRRARDLASALGVDIPPA